MKENVSDDRAGGAERQDEIVVKGEKERTVLVHFMVSLKVSLIESKSNPPQLSDDIFYLSSSASLGCFLDLILVIL